MNGPPSASLSKTCRSLSTAGCGRKHARCATPDIVFPSSARKAPDSTRAAKPWKALRFTGTGYGRPPGRSAISSSIPGRSTAQFLLSLRVYARTRFRVLQACNPPDTIFLIGLFFKLFGVRFIFDHHDLNPELYETKFQRHDLGYKLVCWAERLTFRTADVSIATNESYREVALTRGGMRRERTFVVRSCPDLTRIRIRPPQPELKEGRRHLVVYLGVMGHQDGLDLLLESIAFLTKLRKCEDTLFVLIGSGPELPQLKVLASQKGLDAHGEIHRQAAR